MSMHIDEMVKCARRELFMRKRMYPKWISRGTLSRHMARHEIAAMQAILDLLERTAQERPGSEFRPIQSKTFAHLSPTAALDREALRHIQSITEESE